MLSRKYYNMLAGAIASCTDEDDDEVVVKEALVQELASALQDDSHRFNKTVFVNACYNHQSKLPIEASPTTAMEDVVETILMNPGMVADDLQDLLEGVCDGKCRNCGYYMYCIKRDSP